MNLEPGVNQSHHESNMERKENEDQRELMKERDRLVDREPRTRCEPEQSPEKHGKKKRTKTQQELMKKEIG